MKLIVSIAVAALALSFSLAGCGASSPNCDALKAQCDACNNASSKTVCTAVYDGYVKASSGSEDACKVVVDSKLYAADSAGCK